LLLASQRISEHIVGRASLKILLAIGWMLLASCSRERHLVTRDPSATRTFCLRNVRLFDAPHGTMFTGFRDVVVAKEGSPRSPRRA
jgi:hypothetical protein